MWGVYPEVLRAHAQKSPFFLYCSSRFGEKPQKQLFGDYFQNRPQKKLFLRLFSNPKHGTFCLYLPSDNQETYKSCRTMGKPRLESVNDVVELVVESPAWNKKECNEKQLEEMDPTFRNVVDTHYKS